MDASWPPVAADSSSSRRAQATVNLVDILRSRCLPLPTARLSTIAPIAAPHDHVPLSSPPIAPASKSKSAFTIPASPLRGHIKFRLTGSYNIFEDITPPPYIDNPFAPPSQRHHAVLTRRSKIVSITQCGEFGYAVLCANGLVVFTSSSSFTGADVYQKLNQLIKDKYFQRATRQTSSAVCDTESSDMMTVTQVAALNSSQAHEMAQSYQSALQNPLQSHVFTGVVVNSLYHDEFIRSIEYLPTARALYLAFTHGIDKGLRVRTVALEDLRSGYVYPTPCRTVTGRDVSQQYTEPYGADEVVVWKTDADDLGEKPCLSMDCRAAPEMHERACIDAHIAVDVCARNPSPISLSAAHNADTENVVEDRLHMRTRADVVSGQSSYAGTAPTGRLSAQASGPARARCHVMVRSYGASTAFTQLTDTVTTQPTTFSSFSSPLSYSSSSSYASSFSDSSPCSDPAIILASSDFPAESDLTAVRCPCCTRTAAACPRLIAALLPHAALDVQLPLPRGPVDAAIVRDSVHDLSWRSYAWDRAPLAHTHARTGITTDAAVIPRAAYPLYPPPREATGFSGTSDDVESTYPAAYVHLEDFSPYHLATSAEGAASPPRAPLPMPEAYYLLECACRVFALRHGHRVRVLQWPWYCVSLARQWEVSDERLAALLVTYADWLDVVATATPDAVSPPAVLACQGSCGAVMSSAWTRANTYLPLWCCPVNATVTLPKYLLPPSSTATTAEGIDTLRSSTGAEDAWAEPSLSEAVAVGLGEALVGAPRINGAQYDYSQPTAAAPMTMGIDEPLPLPSCCQLHLACALTDLPPAAPDVPCTSGDASHIMRSAAAAPLASHSPALVAPSSVTADITTAATVASTLPPRAKDKRDKAAKKEKKEKKRAAAAAVADLCYVLHSGSTRYLSRWITLVASMLNTQRPCEQQVVAEVQRAVYARTYTHSSPTAAPLPSAHVGAVQLAPSLFRAICQHWLDMRFLLSLTALPPLLMLPAHLLMHIGRYYALFYPAHCGAPGYTISAATNTDTAEVGAEMDGTATDICVSVCPHVGADTPGTARVAPTGSACTAPPPSSYSSSSGSLASSLAAPTLVLRDIYSFKRNVPDKDPRKRTSSMPAGSPPTTLRSACAREVTVTALPPPAAPLCRRLLALNVDVEVAFAEDVHRAQQEARAVAADAAEDGSHARDTSRTPSSSALPTGVSPSAFPSVLPPLNHAPLPVTPAVLRDTVIPSLLWRLTAREDDAPLESIVKLWPVHDAVNDVGVEVCGARAAGPTPLFEDDNRLLPKDSPLAPQAALELLAALQQPSLDLALSLGGVSLLSGADTGRHLSDAAGHARVQSASVDVKANTGAVFCGTEAEERVFEDMFLCYLHAAASNVALASVIERRATRPTTCAASDPCPPLPPHTPIVSVAVAAAARVAREPDTVVASPFSPKRARVAPLASQQSSGTAATATVSLSALPCHGSVEPVSALATPSDINSARLCATSPSPAAARTLALDMLPFLPRLVVRQLHQRLATPQKRECPFACVTMPVTADAVDDVSAGAADAPAATVPTPVGITHPTPPRRSQPQFSSSSSFSLAFSPSRAAQASCLTPCADAKLPSGPSTSTPDRTSASLPPPFPTHAPLSTLRPPPALQSTPQLLSPVSTPNKRVRARARVNTPSHTAGAAAVAVQTTPLSTARTPQHARTPRPNTGTPRQRRNTPRSMMLGSVPAKPVKACVSQQKSGGKAGSARKLLGLGEDKSKMLKKIPKLVLDRADATADGQSDAAHIADADGALHCGPAAVVTGAPTPTPLSGAIDNTGAEDFAGSLSPLAAEASGPCCNLAAFLFIPMVPAWTLLPVAMLIAHRRMHRTRGLLREQLFRNMFTTITAKSWISRAHYLSLPDLLESLPTLSSQALRGLLDSPAALRSLHPHTDAPTQSPSHVPSLTLSQVRFPAPLQSHVPLWTFFSYRGREVVDVSVHHRRVFVFSSSQTYVDARLPHSLRNHCPWTIKDSTAATLAAAGCIQKAQLQPDGSVRPLVARQGGGYQSWDDVLACGGQPAPELDFAAGGHACLCKDWIFVGKDAALGKAPVSGAIFLGPLAYPNELTCDVTTLCLDSSTCLSAFTLSSRMLEVVAHAHVLERKLALLLAHDLPHSHDQLFPFFLPTRAHHTQAFVAPPTPSGDASTAASLAPATSNVQGAAVRQHHAGLTIAAKPVASLPPPVPTALRTIPLLVAPQVLCDARCCTLCYTSACVQPQPSVSGPSACIDHDTHACRAQPAACGHHCTMPAQLAFEQAFSTTHAVYVKMTGFPMLAIPLYSHTPPSVVAQDTPVALAVDSSVPLPAFHVLPHTSSLGANASAAATLDTLLIQAHSGNGTHADLYALPASALRDVRFDALFPSPPLMLPRPTSGTAAPAESISVGVIPAAADKAGRALCTMPLADQVHLLGPTEVALHTLYSQPLATHRPQPSSSVPPAPRSARSHATDTLTTAEPPTRVPACWSPTPRDTSDGKAATVVSLERDPSSSAGTVPVPQSDSPPITTHSRPSTQSRARSPPLRSRPATLTPASHMPLSAASLSAVPAPLTLPRATPATRTPRAPRATPPPDRTPRAHSATPLLSTPHALAAAESATPARPDAHAHTNAGVVDSMHTAGATRARHGTAPSTPLLSLAHRPTPRRAFASYAPHAYAAARGATGEGVDALVGVSGASALGVIPEDALREAAEVEVRDRASEDVDEQPWTTVRNLYWEMHGAGSRAPTRPPSSSVAPSSVRPVSGSPTPAHHAPRPPHLSHSSPRPRSRTDAPGLGLTSSVAHQHFRVPPTPSSALARAAVSPLPLRNTSPLVTRSQVSARGHLPGTPTLPRQPSRHTSPALARPPLRSPSLFPPLSHTTPTHTVVLPLARPSPFHAAHATSASAAETQGDRPARTHTPLLRPKRTRMGLAELLASSSSDPMTTPTAASPPVVFPPLTHLTHAPGPGSPGAPSPLLASATAHTHRPDGTHTSVLGTTDASTISDSRETTAADVPGATAPLEALDAAQGLPSPKRMRVADDVDGHAQSRPYPRVGTPTDASKMPCVPATPTTTNRLLAPTSSPASPLCHSRYARTIRAQSPSSHALPSAPQLPPQFEDYRTSAADTHHSLSSAFSALPRALSPSQGYVSQPLPDADALADQHVEWALPALPKPRVPPEQWSPRLMARRPGAVNDQAGIDIHDAVYSPSSASSSSSLASSSSFSSPASLHHSLGRPSSVRAAAAAPTPFSPPSARTLTPSPARSRTTASADEPVVRLSFSPRILSTPSNPYLAHTHTPRLPRQSSSRRASPPPHNAVDTDTEALPSHPFTPRFTPRMGRRARATPSSSRTDTRIVVTSSHSDTASIFATPAPPAVAAFGAHPHTHAALSSASVAAPTPTRDMNALGALLEPVLDVISNVHPYAAAHAMDMLPTTTSPLPTSSADSPSSPSTMHMLTLGQSSLPPTPLLTAPASPPVSSPAASSRAFSPSRPHAPDCTPTPTLSPRAEGCARAAPSATALTVFPAHTTNAMSAAAADDAVSAAATASQSYIHTSVPALARPSLREPAMPPMVHCVDDARAQVAIYRPCTSLSSWGLIPQTHTHPYVAPLSLNFPSAHHVQLSAVFMHALASAAAVPSPAGLDVSHALLRTFDWCLPANMLPSHRAAHWTTFLQLLQQRTRVELRDMVRHLCTRAMHTLTQAMHVSSEINTSHAGASDIATATSAPRHLGAYSPSAQPPPLPRLTDSALRRASDALVSALSNTSNSFSLLSQDPHAFVTSLMGYMDICDLRTGRVLYRVLPESLRSLYAVSAHTSAAAAPSCARHCPPASGRDTHPGHAIVPTAPAQRNDFPIRIGLIPALPPAKSALPATSSADATGERMNLSLAAFARAAPQEEAQLEELHAAAMAQEREKETALLNRRCCRRRYGLDAAGEFLWPVATGAGVMRHEGLCPREKYNLSLLLPPTTSLTLNRQTEADASCLGQSSMPFRHLTSSAAPPPSVERRLCELLASKHTQLGDLAFVSAVNTCTDVPRVTRSGGTHNEPSIPHSLTALLSTTMRTYTQRAFPMSRHPVVRNVVAADISSSLFTLSTTSRAPTLLKWPHASSLPRSVSAPVVAPFDPRTLTTLCSRLRISTDALATALQRASLLPSALTAPRYLVQPGPQRRMGVDESVFARAFAVWCAWAGICAGMNAARPSCSLCETTGIDGTKRFMVTYSSFPIAFVPDHVLTAIVTVNYDASAQELLLGNSYGLLFQVSVQEVDSVTLVDV